ncbi:hypothetical protein SAMN06297251_11798 [Fulvimarina manganoxydans]|uniref:Uncharacterized protein n=1 Tax=Fulvimarina manganoxydans TaxID=937218 RepID=A0A1W2DU10_9HYPH|nr:hypothetical protein [Fulvimarina manganoxydans]SMD00556.1 hypothetical protein SAMN06297251_11798 [Fulvimarina manganoxydans]
MLSAIILAASALAIPFESSPAPEKPAASAPATMLETSFEFAEREGSYQLNALLFDLSAGTRASTPIASCRSIDIASFEETAFGTPVSCDGVSFSFDVRDGAVLVDAASPQPPIALRRLSPGRVFVNGMPLLIEASR